MTRRPTPRVFGVGIEAGDGMKIMRRISCLFGKHHRDRHSVWHDGDSFRATCAGCRAAMVRDFHGWHLVGSATGQQAIADK